MAPSLLAHAAPEGALEALRLHRVELLEGLHAFQEATLVDGRIEVLRSLDPVEHDAEALAADLRAVLELTRCLEESTSRL